MCIVILQKFSICLGQKEDIKDTKDEKSKDSNKVYLNVVYLLLNMLMCTPQQTGCLLKICSGTR